MRAKTIGIILIILMSSFILDRGLSFVLDKLYEINRFGQSGGNLNYYLSESKKEAFDFTILGNSRAHHNLNPDSLGGRGFNLSHNGMNLSFQVALLHVLASQNALPKNKIILHIEPNEFRNWPDSSKFYSDAQHLKHYYYKDKLVKKYINAISETEFIKYYFYSYRFNGQLPSLLKNVLTTLSSKPTGNGFYGKPHEKFHVPIIKRQAEDLKKLDTKSIKVEDYYAHPTKLLDVAKNICDRNHLELELFSSPYYFTPDIYKWYSKKVEKWSVENNILYRNFVINKISKFDSITYWRDNDHLSAKGAALFSSGFSKK